MENIYLYMIIALAILAIADLVVGVSNDAVNFLNSAIGSKAISFKTIMIVASLGVAVGAVFSSGMMEVARKGIFNPSQFMFDEIMIIFMAVMITDILLLDFFNSVGMPTSTTVSIVFELLGAAVAVALIKIGHNSGDFGEVIRYINTSKASQIIFGILLSVVVAFSVGAFVQWVSRLLLSYNFEKKANWVGALFGGIALTAITYFIFMKGLKGTSYAKESFDILGGATMKDFLENQVLSIVAVSLTFWSILSFVLISAFKTNIYKLIIVVGTFALALAFAGNDLVNFIGVPMAAYNAYDAWMASGDAASSFSMEILAEKVPTNNWLLLAAGMIMVLTLWFSTKAKNVVKTSLDLSSQSNTKERFQPNFLSRGFVRSAMLMSQMSSYILPESWQQKIDKQFEAPKLNIPKNKEVELPAFDLVRAAVNLMVAAVLISIATSYKLPLSTTYVTFMV
ncbi:MAG: inorganic phosphate transporter, partial [Mesoflavibacter sp.]|nr:inorganic phosphate transporter [Mesoflavibacter sp.]